jgi:hypothetical protein
MQETPGDNTPGTGPDPFGGTPAPVPPPPPPPPPPTGGPGKGLFDRARDIIMRPAHEWAVIDREPATVGSVFVPYALILAAIGPIASLIGMQVFGINLGLLSYKPPIGSSIAIAAISYVINLAGVFVLALIIDALAPSFGGTKNQVQATKLVVYSYTAAWLAGIFGLLPALAILSIVGLYSFYLLFVGLPILMKVPKDKAVGYFVVVILAAIVMWILIGYIVMQLTWSFWAGGIPTVGLR